MNRLLSYLHLPFSILGIAWRSVRHRRVAALLTMLSMGLGVMLIVSVLTMFGVVTESFRSNSSLGYDMIVGAKGGKLQLTLNSVYYLSTPIETIPYEYYLEFYDGETREAELENSIAYHVHEAQWNATALDLLTSPAIGMSGPAAWVQASVFSAIEEDSRAEMRLDADGRFYNYADLAIPICLGDYFHEFRAVATNPDFFSELILDYETKYNPETGEYEDEYFETAQGRFFEHESEENGFFECVVGSTVARKHHVKLGDYINPTHGAPDGHTHQNGFKVVGILKPTGTPNDRAVFVNIEGFFLMEDHAMTLDKSESDDADDADDADTATGETDANAGDKSGERMAEIVESSVADAEDIFRPHREPLPMEQRQVSAILVRSSDPTGLGAMYMERPINKGVLRSSLNWSPYQPAKNLKQDAAQAVQPMREIESLISMFVTPIQYVLLFLTGMICLVSGISILVSIYNSMAERRHEIAVMRSLGASRAMVMLIILAESVILSVLGGFAGWIGGHALNVLVNQFVEPQTGVKIGFFNFAPPLPLIDLPGQMLDKVSPEWLLIPALIVLAIVVGLYPAFAAYRTDVSKSL
jgi:putative ABC transport system permease protein